MNRLQWTTEFLHSTRECRGKDVSVRLQERLPRIGSPRVDTTLDTLIKALYPRDCIRHTIHNTCAQHIATINRSVNSLHMQNFQVVTDHNPLLAVIPILNSHRLEEIENPRLQCLRTQLMGYNFTEIWRKGSTHGNVYFTDPTGRNFFLGTL